MGCVVAFLASIGGAFVLSCAIYAVQAMFNPKPLYHENWGMGYLVTIPVGAIAGFVTVCAYWLIHAYWQYWPRKRWLVLAFLIFTLLFCVWGYNPGDPSDPNDSTFSLD
jgi:hypothetical protein